MADVTTELRREGLGYAYYASGFDDSGLEPVPWGVCIRARYLRRHGGELTAEVITTYTDREPDHLLRTKLNFSIDSSRDKLASSLIKKEKLPPWRDLLEDFCVSVILTEEKGNPTQTIGNLPDTEPEPDQVDGMVPWRKVTLFFAHGGTGKGWTTMLLACCIAHGIPFLGRPTRKDNVMVLDWEDDLGTADRRIKKLCRGLGIERPTLKYRTMRGPLYRQIEAIAEDVTKHHIGVVIVDSANWAIGTSEFQDATAQFFESLSLLNVTAIVIDHVSKAVVAAKDTEGTPYGDVYKHNAARATWELRKEQTPGANVSVVSLFNRKANHDKLSEPFAVRLTFEPDRVQVEAMAMYRDEATGKWAVNPHPLEDW